MPASRPNPLGPQGLPTTYTVGTLPIFPNVVLAPMEGVTDITFRRLIRAIGGAGLTCTEFLPSEGLRRGGHQRGKLAEMAEFDEDERPISIQIYGRRPESMAEAARVVEAMGATLIDINMGCPSKKVCAHSGGSALMADLPLARAIIAAVRAAVRLPLTVKMRSGFDHANRNAAELAQICEGEGADAITIHWRTRADLYGGQRAVDRIAEAKSLLRIPVIGNGDVIDPLSAERMMRETGCDGVMVGRGAMRNPWVLRQIAEHLQGLPLTEVDATEKERVLLQLLQDMRERFHRDLGALGRFKKVSNYFCKSLPYGEKALRTPLLRSNTIEEAQSLVHTFFSRLRAHEAGDHQAFAEYGLEGDEPVEATSPLEPLPSCLAD